MTPNARVAMVAAALLATLAAMACAPSVAPSNGPAAGAAPRRPDLADSRDSSPAGAPAASPDPDVPPAEDARLQPSTCEEQDGLVKERVEQMRAEVDAEFQRWHDAQPGCWEEDRRREAMRKAMETCARGGDCVLAGGLELQGSGIGLGSIGTIGHGRGVARAASTMSGTNNQVAAVDEADIVKSDGRYVYIVANGALRILEAMSPRVLSVTRIPGDVRELLVEGDRAVVFAASGEGTPRCTYAYDCVVAGDGTSTRIHVFDIHDRSAPRAVRRIDLSGSLIASRRIGKAIYAVVSDGDTLTDEYRTWPDDLPMCGTPESTVRAKLARLRKENERTIRASHSVPTMTENGTVTPLCSRLLEAKNAPPHTFTTVLSFGINDGFGPPQTATVRSRPGAVFASEDSLYIAAWRAGLHGGRALPGGNDDATDLHAFRIDENPGDMRYIGSGIVAGHVLNQFSMDEWRRNLRIATTRGRVPDPEVESTVSTFTEGPNKTLVRVGVTEPIARGEDIRAVRFDDDRAYVVTFKKTDPLYVVDLHDAAHPSVLGELKIPGFSTYLHRIDATHLLSIGFDAVDHGDRAYFDGVLLQLFDVSDPLDPRLLHREKLGTRGSSSEAATDHLAFNYFAERGLLALPMTLCGGGGDGVFATEKEFSGLVVYRVDATKGFTPLGGIDHGLHGVSCDTWWSRATSTVKRSLFLDDLVYSMAMDRVKVQRLGALGRDVADLSLKP